MTRWARIPRWLQRIPRSAAELGLGPLMLLVAGANEDAFTALVAIFLLLPAPKITWDSWRFQSAMLNESRARDETLPLLERDANNARLRFEVSAAAAIAGALVVGRAIDLIMVPIPRPIFLVIIAFSLVANTIPAISDKDFWKRVKAQQDTGVITGRRKDDA